MDGIDGKNEEYGFSSAAVLWVIVPALLVMAGCVLVFLAGVVAGGGL